VEPGVCGFSCTVCARKSIDGKISITINNSDCELVQKMSKQFHEITFKDLFSSVAENPVFEWAARARCHTPCLVPFAILKASEVEAGMALPRKAGIEFI
jgi:hypothetical protein